MAGDAYEKEELLTRKLIDKYGSEYGISVDLVNKVFAGTATKIETQTYTENVGKLVMRFKSDMRMMEPNNYTDADVEIVMAMADANYRYFENNEPFSKVIPMETALQNLNQTDATVLTGSVAVSRNSENLSPQQIISQFGLDYQQTTNGVTETPYLVKDGDQYIKQPFVFNMETPMTDEIHTSAKLPVDPRLLARFEKMAVSGNAEQREQASRFLNTYKDKMILIVRNQQDLESVKQQYPNYTIKKALEPPYTGTTAPIYGEKLVGSYADIVQEMYMSPVQKVAPGTVISVKLPRVGAGVNSDRSDLPAGSEKVNIARWNGQRWEPLVSAKTLQTKFDRAVKIYRPSISKGWRESFNKFLKEMPIKVPEALKQHITNPKPNKIIKKKLKKSR